MKSGRGGLQRLIGIGFLTVLCNPAQVLAEPMEQEASKQQIPAYSVPPPPLKIKEPPLPQQALLKTHQEGAYQVHIFRHPNPDKTAPQDRSVLMLGMFSGPGAVQKAAQLNNPATGKPYDVVIGVMPELPLQGIHFKLFFKSRVLNWRCGRLCGRVINEADTLDPIPLMNPVQQV